jgi:methylated-DNA-protein-cysteine methyltransferase-like protein
MAALRGAPTGEPVPWHRVLNAKGMSSIGGSQLEHLAAEGIEIDARGRVDLDRHGWDGSEWIAETP